MQLLMAHLCSVRVIAALTLATCFAMPAQAEKRVALVVGNSAYQNVAQLPNPVKDAQAIAGLFKSAGFDVVNARSNLGNLEFKRALREFTSAAREADIAIVYFAGHGIEVKGINYLIPVDAKLATDYDAEDEAVSLNRVIEAMEPAIRLRLIILDACRNNPFIRTMQRTVPMRMVPNNGLAKVEPAGTDTLIAYAAKAGSTAEDGKGTHSPFTAALLKHLTVPGRDIRIAFGHVRDEVLTNTGKKQEPFVYGSLGGGTLALVSAPAPVAVPSVSPPFDPDSAIRRDYEFAERVGTREGWDFFLSIYSKGYYAKLAQAQRNKLAAEEARIAATEKAKAALEEKNRFVLEGAKAAEQAKVVALAKTAEQTRVAAELAKKAEDAKVAEAERIRAAALAKVAEAQNNLKIASLPPPADSAAAMPTTPALFGSALVQEIKKELKRVGCYLGHIDDNWTTADTKSSIIKFVKFANLPNAPNVPLPDFLATIRSKSQRVCPTECGAREVEKDGKCVAIPNVSSASDNAQPSGSGRKCLILGNQSFCE